MEKVILIGIKFPKTSNDEVENSILELSRLAQTAGAYPVESIVQKKNSIDPAYLIGSGKALEIKDRAKSLGIKTIIFDEDLKPVQQQNLEKLMELKVVDRTRLILDIFAKRARTKEGILQVERAQLEYLLPRITERFGRFEQQVGGIGTRGPGERKLEVDQRRIRDRIAFLDKQIENIKLHRNIQRKKRSQSGKPIIAIAGYTNAGKSTLLNYISISSKIYADDKLFATLDPTTRIVPLPGKRKVLFSDTVGFISKLPHALVAAFRSTLEEITRASLILHVIDISHKDYEKQAKTTLTVLSELETKNIPLINVYNKADLLGEKKRKELSKSGHLLISAKSGLGITRLLNKIEKIIVPKMNTHNLTLTYEQTKLLSKIFELSVIKKQNYTEKGITLNLKSTKERWSIIKAMAAKD